jgi:hypothetical protein
MASHLYVSFWDLCLDNLPEGRFEHRVIGASEASAMIRGARTDKTLLCVSKDDLLAPYRTNERRRHEELCMVLGASYGCPLRLEDFLTTFEDEETAVQSITPLQVAELQSGDRLLVVTCDYQFADKTEERVAVEDRFVLAAASVGFHLIAALSPREAATT